MQNDFALSTVNTRILRGSETFGSGCLKIPSFLLETLMVCYVDETCQEQIHKK